MLTIAQNFTRTAYFISILNSNKTIKQFSNTKVSEIESKCEGLPEAGELLCRELITYSQELTGFAGQYIVNFKFNYKHDILIKLIFLVH